jgi:uncharacterized protein (DUF1778 family)
MLRVTLEAYLMIETETKITTFRCPLDLREALERRCEVTKSSLTSFVVSAIQEKLAREKVTVSDSGFSVETK